MLWIGDRSSERDKNGFSATYYINAHREFVRFKACVINEVVRQSQDRQHNYTKDNSFSPILTYVPDQTLT